MKTYSLSSGATHTEITLSDLLARSTQTILYFYPKDNTPGCTLEAQDFTRLKKDFATLGIQIVGVSLDDAKSHAKFTESCGLGIDLISDDGSLHEMYGIIGDKNLYGKIVRWVIRSTFLLDQSGKMLREWRSVRATGHAEKILKELQV